MKYECLFVNSTAAELSSPAGNRPRKIHLTVRLDLSAPLALSALDKPRRDQAGYPIGSFTPSHSSVLFSLLLQTTPSNSIALFAPYILIAVVFYFLLFMPMQRQKKKQQQMLADLKSGDMVITSGGIVGTITAVENDTIIVRVKPDNLKLQFARSAVSSLVPTESPK